MTLPVIMNAGSAYTPCKSNAARGRLARAAKTKRKGTGRRAKANSPGALPVPESELDALVSSFMRMLEDDDEVDEALELAREKAFEAMEAPRADERIALAKEALALSPLCSDAYLVLARETADGKEALELYRRAVAVGAEALG